MNRTHRERELLYLPENKRHKMFEPCQSSKWLQLEKLTQIHAVRLWSPIITSHATQLDCMERTVNSKVECGWDKLLPPVNEM